MPPSEPLRTSSLSCVSRRRWCVGCWAAALLLLLLVPAPVLAGAQEGLAPIPGALGVQIPRVFVPGPGVPSHFVSPFGPAVVRAEVGGVSILLSRRGQGGAWQQHVLRLAFEGCESVAPEAVTAPGTAGWFHLLAGRDPSGWRRHLPATSGLVYRGIYPGIDLHVGWHEGQLAFQADVAPGADPSALRWRIQGVESGGIEETADGGVRVEVPAGALQFGAPACLTSQGQATHRCRLGSGDLVLIEPAVEGSGDVTSVVWSTFLGGSNGSVPTAVMIGDDGAVTIAGYTFSPDFPVTPGALDDLFDDAGLVKREGFITRLDPDAQQHVFSTFLGGAEADSISRARLLPDGEILVAGVTASPEFPVTAGAFDSTLSPTDGFVAKLSPGGDDILAATFIGGDQASPIELKGLDVSPSGRVAIVGVTRALDYPTTPGAAQETFPGSTQQSGFVSVFESGLGRLVFSSFLGGSETDWAQDVRFGADESVYVVGETRSPDFPLTAGGFQTEGKGLDEAFVCRVAADGMTLLASTLLSGPHDDMARGLDLMPDGSLAVVGETQAPGFPVTLDAFDPVGGGFVADAFVAVLDASLSNLLYATYLGSAGIEWPPYAIVAGPSGEITVAGGTNWEDFPVTPGAFQTALNDFSRDAWVARLHPSGQSLVYATYLGGSEDELLAPTDAVGLAVDAQGRVLFAADSASSDFPTSEGAFMEDLPGSSSAFVTQLTMLPEGVQVFGGSTPGPAGPLAIGVNSPPRLGNSRFKVTCSNAPSRASGAIALSLVGLDTPVGLAGSKAWVDPAALVGFLPMASGVWGWAEILLPVPDDPDLIGLSVYAQTFWPGGQGGLSASNGLKVTLAP